MPPEFLYFDLGNVLLTFDNDRMCRQMGELLGADEASVRGFVMPTGGESDLQWRFECGLLSEAEYLQQVCDHFGASPDHAALAVAASDIFAPIEPAMRLADALAKAGWRLGLLSNTNWAHWRFVMDGRYPVLRSAFEVEMTSFAAQSMKPDAGIYRRAIEATGVPAERVFFTDDKPENVASAREAGIDAVVFTSTEQLIADLQSRGVIAE
ncbi:MAG: HAD family phosphatase [Planctomycetota bacterium]